MPSSDMYELLVGDAFVQLAHSMCARYVINTNNIKWACDDWSGGGGFEEKNDSDELIHKCIAHNITLGICKYNSLATIYDVTI